MLKMCKVMPVSLVKQPVLSRLRFIGDELNFDELIT